MRLSLKSASIPGVALLGCAWLAYGVFGDAASRAVEHQFRDALLRVADGKFSDPIAFIHGRILEFLFLATLAVLLALAAACLWQILTRKDRWRKARGLVMGVAVFGFLNLLAWGCGRTVLFWSLFYDRTHINNFAQYHIKKILLAETSGKQHAVLMGNSQANRSIDEALLNQTIGRALWTTELTQAGARGFDLLTLSRDIPFERGDLMICYVSEISFYGTGSGIVAADFMNFSEIPDVLEFEGLRLITPGAVRSGLLGRIVPFYRFRMSVAKMALGWDFINISQQRFDQSLEPDLAAQAKEWAPKLRIGETSRFEQAAFARMVDELSVKGCTTLLIAGHVHPTLLEHMDPAVIQHFDQFLMNQQSRHPGDVILLDSERLYRPTASDFGDLVHFNDEAQAAFTRRLIEYLTFEIPRERLPFADFRNIAPGRAAGQPNSNPFQH